MYFEVPTCKGNNHFTSLFSTQSARTSHMTSKPTKFPPRKHKATFNKQNPWRRLSFKINFTTWPQSYFLQQPSQLIFFSNCPQNSNGLPIKQHNQWRTYPNQIHNHQKNKKTPIKDTLEWNQQSHWLTLASSPNSFLKIPIEPGPQTSCVIKISTLTQTLSPGLSWAFSEALANIFSVIVIAVLTWNTSTQAKSHTKTKNQQQKSKRVPKNATDPVVEGWRWGAATEQRIPFGTALKHLWEENA